MHRDRIDAVLACARQTPGARTVLDLGCAQGNTGLLLAEEGFEVYAVDLRPEFLEYAGLKYERGAFHRIAADAQRLPFPDGRFDLVIWGEIIEHVAFPERMLGEIARILQPQGFLVVSTPNGQRFHTGLPTFSKAGDRKRFVADQFKPDADGHLFLFTRAEMLQLLELSGFTILRHEFYATPWISGRLGFRHFLKWTSKTCESGLTE